MKKTFLVGLLLASLFISLVPLTTVQAQGPVEDPEAADDVTIEIDVPTDSPLEDGGDFVLQANVTPPTIEFKLLPSRPTAGKGFTNIEISTQNFKTNELTEGVFLKVNIDYPKRPLFVPTVTPTLENTSFFYAEFTSKQGVVLLENVLFPIRGSYKVEVQARAIDGLAFEPITKTFTIRVWPSLMNFVIWLLIFGGAFAVGVFTFLKKKPRR